MVSGKKWEEREFKRRYLDKFLKKYFDKYFVSKAYTICAKIF